MTTSSYEANRIEPTTEARPIVDRVPVDPDPISDGIPDDVRQQVYVDVIHDGHWIPEEFLVDRDGRPIPESAYRAEWVAERDWGASCLAERLAVRLGLHSYARVNVARVLMDFGRFPGSTPRNADHLHRFAINYPFSSLLSYAQKKSLLEGYYDRVSDALDHQLEGRRFKIAIHTYDRLNESGTERPAVSLLTRSIGYQTESELPAGLFDPLCPDVLAEDVSDRVLRDRISLTLEKARVPVAHNYPYCLPEGSLEVRYQVWSWFHYLRRVYLAEHPETRDDPAHRMVWQMLMDTNLRSTESEALRSYVHMYRRPPGSLHRQFAEAAAAYEAIASFSHEPERRILDRYRFSAERTSAIGIEVRKDLVGELDDEGVLRNIRRENVDFIADTIAEAVTVYLRDDRAPDAPLREELGQRQPWYSARLRG